MREVTDAASFKQTNSGKCVVLVGSPTCQPCKQMAAVFDSIPENGIPFYKADLMEIPEVFMELNIMSIPTILFKADGKVVDRCGAVGPSELKEKLKNF